MFMASRFMFLWEWVCKYWVSVSESISCAFFGSLFLLFLLAYSNVFVFILSCLIIIPYKPIYFPVRNRSGWERGWGRTGRNRRRRNHNQDTLYGKMFSIKENFKKELIIICFPKFAYWRKMYWLWILDATAPYTFWCKLKTGTVIFTHQYLRGWFHNCNSLDDLGTGGS